MQTIFQHRGYSIDCTPRDLQGEFGANAVLSKIGHHPEKTFSALPVFATAPEAIAHAKTFSEAWLERYA